MERLQRWKTSEILASEDTWGDGDGVCRLEEAPGWEGFLSSHLVSSPPAPTAIIVQVISHKAGFAVKLAAMPASRGGSWHLFALLAKYSGHQDMWK